MMFYLIMLYRFLFDRVSCFYRSRQVYSCAHKHANILHAVYMCVYVCV